METKKHVEDPTVSQKEANETKATTHSQTCRPLGPGDHKRQHPRCDVTLACRELFAQIGGKPPSPPPAPLQVRVRYKYMSLRDRTRQNRTAKKKNMVGSSMSQIEEHTARPYKRTGVPVLGWCLHHSTGGKKKHCKKNEIFMRKRKRLGGLHIW